MPQKLSMEIQKCAMLILENCLHFCLCVAVIMFIFQCLYHNSIYLYFMCMDVLTLLYLYTMCMQCLQRTEEGIRSFETSVSAGCEPSYECQGQTQVLCKSNKTLKFYTISLYLKPVSMQLYDHVPIPLCHQHRLNKLIVIIPFLGTQFFAQFLQLNISHISIHQIYGPCLNNFPNSKINLFVLVPCINSTNKDLYQPQYSPFRNFGASFFQVSLH